MNERDNKEFADQTYQRELEEWSNLNTSLRQHGMTPITLVHPNDINKMPDIVVLTAEASKCVRQSLQMLLKDGDRRQDLVQDMIVTNNQLREQLKSQSKYEERISELKADLNESTARLQELELNRMNESTRLLDESERMYGTQALAQAKLSQMQQKCELYEKEMKRLADKIKRLNDEDDRRRKRENEVFEHLRKKPGKETIDETILSIIDSYERQIYHLKHELEGNTNESADQSHQTSLLGTVHPLSNNSTTFFDAESTPNFKAFIRAYEKRLNESKKKLKSLEESNEMMKLELQSRPQMKDFRDSQVRNKRLERLLKNKNVSVCDFESDCAGKHSTKLSDLQSLPSCHCQKYLQTICSEINVADLDEIVPKLRQTNEEACAYSRLEKFAKEILDLTNIPDVPKPRDVRRRANCSASHPHEVWCEKSWHHVIPTLEYWIIQLKSLKELQRSIKNLSEKLFPWKPIKLDEHVCTTQLIEVVDALMYERDDEGRTAGSQVTAEQVTKDMLLGIVKHFQELFDVPRISGVYTRMSDIYRKLGETHNVLQTLKDFLGLDDSAKSGAVVDAVAQLCDTHNLQTQQQLAKVLHVDEVGSLVVQLEEQNEFFSIFHETMQQLMTMLNVQTIDDILPTVSALLIHDATSSSATRGAAVRFN